MMIQECQEDLEALQTRVASIEADFAAAREVPPPAPDPEPEPNGPQCGLIEDGVWGLPDEPIDIEEAAEFGRALLHQDADGAFDGFRLSGIRLGSTLQSCGIRNGAIVYAVNGKAMTSMTAAMTAYTEMTELDEFTVDVGRLGSRSTNTYLRVP